MTKEFRVFSLGTLGESKTNRQERISWWNQDDLEESKILVVGAGALGNEVIKNLMLLGCGNIAILDFDIISPSNLSRTVLFRCDDVGKSKAFIAKKRASKLAVNDNINILSINADAAWSMGRSFYQQFDIVLGCLDNIECRRAVSNYCYLTETPFIDAGIMELRGHFNFIQW